MYFKSLSVPYVRYLYESMSVFLVLVSTRTATSSTALLAPQGAHRKNEMFLRPLALSKAMIIMLPSQAKRLREIHRGGS